MTNATPAIAVANLVKRYPQAKFNAVDGLSFEVRRGEVFGLLGPNGAGKTTTIGVLTTAVVPTSGSASIMGFDVAADAIRVKQRIAVVPQRSNLDRSLRVREILTFHAAYHGVPRRQREAMASQLLDELGLADRSKEKVDRYSGGMAQRLMIARALMHEPDVLFLDEPTNNLDPQSRLFIWDRVRALNARGATILLTTHDMDEADQLCRRIAVMDHGRILVDDTPAELKKLIPGGNALEVHVQFDESAPDQNVLRELLLQSLRILPAVAKVEEVRAAPSAAAAAAAPGGGSWIGGRPSVGGESAAPEPEHGVSTFRIYAHEAGALIGPVAQAVLDAGGRVRDISVKQASLEEVFIYLTGRHLR